MFLITCRPLLSLHSFLSASLHVCPACVHIVSIMFIHHSLTRACCHCVYVRLWVSIPPALNFFSHPSLFFFFNISFDPLSHAPLLHHCPVVHHGICRLLWSGRVRPGQGVPAAHYHLHRRLRKCATAERDHTPPGGKRTHTHTELFVNQQKTENQRIQLRSWIIFPA